MAVAWPQQRLRRPELTTLIIFVLGVVSLLLVFLTARLFVENRHFFHYTDVTHELQIEISKARIWLEEFGRGTIRLTGGKDCWERIDTAVRMTDVLLQGGMTPHGAWAAPLADTGQRRIAEEVRALLLEYRRLARDRYALRLSHPRDDRLETVFSEALDKSFTLDEMIEADQVRNEAKGKRLFAGIVGSWSLLILAVAIGFRRYEAARKQDEIAILDAAHEWERTFDAVPDQIMIVDRQFRVRRMNRALAEGFGGRLNELLGRPCCEIQHPGSSRPPDCPHARTLGDGKGHSAQVFDEQSGRHFLVTSSPLLDRNGVVDGSVHIARDITAQKRSEEIMQVKDHAIASSLNAIVISDLDGKITYANKAFLAWWGFRSEEEVVGLHAVDIASDPADAEEIMGKLRAAGGWSGERTAQRRDGTTFDVSVTAHLVRDGNGRPLCMMASFADITERRLLEKKLDDHQRDLEDLVKKRTAELRESESMYRRLSKDFNVILDAIPDALLLFGTDRRVVWANQAAIATLGRSAETFTGRRCAEIWHERDELCTECPLHRSFESGSREHAQVATPDKRLWAIRAYPILDESGRIASVMQLATDITDKVMMQAEHMRAMHLAALGELAAGVAHEINNPINGIINYAQILARQPGQSDEGRDISSRIIREGGRIATIVKSLLSFARDRKEDKAPADIAVILQETLSLTETQLRKNGILYEVALPPLPAVFANVQQIQQVFLNVINNARYALNERYPSADRNKKLVISGEAVSEDGRRYARIRFRDNGTGIPSQIVNRVMDPFFTTKPAGVGTGLGLSISHGIISAHEGRMMIESAENSHTTVIIDLPVAGGQQ